MTSTTLRLALQNGGKEWPVAQVAELRRPGDSVANGVIWGAVVGGAIAGVLGGTTFAICANDNGVNCPRLKFLSTVPPVLAGIAIGALIDALRDNDTVVYRRS